MVSQSVKFRMGEPFRGQRGMASGAHLAALGLKEVALVQPWASDLDSDPRSTHRMNIPEVPRVFVICEGVRTPDLLELSAIDGLAFDFPSNDSSTVGKSFDKCVSNHQATKHTPHRVESVSHKGPGENAFSAELPEHLKLPVRGATISQMRLRWRAGHPSFAVTCSVGGGTHFYHCEENRALANRERERPQTFPDTFEILGVEGSARRGIGKDLPVAGAKVTFRALFNSLFGVDYSNARPDFRDFSAVDVRHAEAKVAGAA